MNTYALLSLTVLFSVIIGLVTCDSIGDSFRSTQSNDSRVTINGDVLLKFNPSDELNVAMDETEISHVSYNFLCDNDRVSYVINFKSARSSVASLQGRTSFNIGCLLNGSTTETAANTSNKYPVFIEGNFSISVFGDLLGRTKLNVDVVRFLHRNTSVPEPSDFHNSSPSTSNRYSFEYAVVVRRVPAKLTTAFRVLISLFMVATSVAMGCKTDLRVVMADLKKPVAPAIGLFCQYVVMPMIAFAIASTVPFDDPIMSFGIFALGCSPGGGSSNVYAYLIGGDVSLSVTMTTVSSFLSLGLFPLWVLTLGRRFLPEENGIEIPYLNVFLSILAVVLPLGIGLLIQYKKPKVAKALLKYSKPVLYLVIIVVAVLMVISNLYMFQLFTPITMLGGACLPYFGFLLGGTIAWITRNPWTRIKTISLETGLQNVGVAMITILFSLPTPYSEIAAVCPAASALMSSFLVGSVVTVYVVREKCKEKFSKKNQPGEAVDTAECYTISGKMDQGKNAHDSVEVDEIRITA